MTSGYLFRPMNVGLGLTPHLTGRGLGLTFLLAGLEFARRRFAPDSLRLSVATFNERDPGLRARWLPACGIFMQSANGGAHPFLLMAREA
jgi:[ribosomal protein S18]-alanine N-acetyltransferase